MPKTKRQIAHEVDEILAGRYGHGPSVVIDHADIRRSDLRIARENARRDPDGQIFPWRSGYPLVGSTVYFDGRLWTVSKKERGPGSEQPTANVRLVSQGDDDTAIATLGELRPVTWTQHDEDWRGRE